MFEQKLTEKIGYAEGGQQIMTDVVEVSAPSKKQYRQTYLLQQIVAKALMVAARDRKGDSKASAPAEKQPELTPDQKAEEEAGRYAEMKYSLIGGDADLEACVMQVEKLAIDGCVKVAGNKINRIQWENIDPVDQEKICFRFISDFIMPLV